MMPTFLTSLRLDSRLAEPLYRQIYLRIKDAIARATAAGSRLPSVRGLASDLGVARATVESAYAQLIAEGFCRAGGRQAPMSRRSCRPCRGGVRCTAVAGGGARSAAAAGHAAAFPTGRAGAGCVSTCAVAAHCRPPAARFYGGFHALPPAGGLPELREAIAHYLHLSRGISCQPEQIFLCAGYPALLDWVVETLLHAGDAVWIEDPGYPVTRPLLRAAGVRPVAVPVDEQGMDVATGILTEPEARLAVVTPTHQSPLGVSLSRRGGWRCSTGAAARGPDPRG